MYRSINSPAFERDVKKCMKKHWDMGSFKAAISAILHSDEEPIPLKYNDHALSGNLQGKRELHVKGRTSDWLIMCANHCEIICVYRDGKIIDSWGNRCDKGAVKAG